MFGSRKKVKETFGLDMGSHSIKVASVIKEADKPLLTACNIKKIPSGDEKSVKIGKLIGEAFSEVGASPVDVNLSISGSNVIVRFITLPKMNKAQLENAMIFEAERYIPFNVSEVILDFIILDDAAEGQMNVLLAAAKRDFIQSQVDLFRKIGLNVNLIDVSAFALFNAFMLSNELPGDKGVAFLDLGHSQTNVLVVTGGMPRFMRVVQIGGGDITRAIIEETGLTNDKAEELKATGGGEFSEKVKQATVEVLDELVKEMQLSFGYFENKYSIPVSNIYCSGGMIYQAGVVEYLQEKLGIGIQKWSPIDGIAIAENIPRESIDPVAQQIAVSIGLAIRE